VAIDAGGTGTRCVVASNQGAVLGTGRGGPGNQILAGWETARASLAEATTAALHAAPVTADRVDVVVVGSSGVGANGQGGEFVRWLLAEIAPQLTQVVVTGDMVTALWGALQPPVGVVVCAGTGSVCFGRNADGRTCQVGGWGHILGDEGSAYDIATRALRAMARAADGRGSATALSDVLIAAVGERTAVDTALRIYSEPLSREHLAALAVQVVAAARAGDQTALGILQHAGDELGLAAVTALRALDLADRTTPVSFAGAVFEAGDLVIDAFRARVHAAAPHAEIRAPLLPPVGGAFCLGMERLGEPVDAAVLARLQAGLNGSGL
jgi:N-acetylglucosamine kinase-like BadF-type ATPase